MSRYFEMGAKLAGECSKQVIRIFRDVIRDNDNDHHYKKK